MTTGTASPKFVCFWRTQTFTTKAIQITLSNSFALMELDSGWSRCCRSSVAWINWRLYNDPIHDSVHTSCFGPCPPLFVPKLMNTQIRKPRLLPSQFHTIVAFVRPNSSFQHDYHRNEVLGIQDNTGIKNALYLAAFTIKESMPCSFGYSQIHLTRCCANLRDAI